ncbi:MAG: clostripain-related cysteine peptidase [Lachnospiraceae bacterium]|nr:clostripain-related cysteine peptidase [Lachnospiraceae bacterium]MDD3616200.1 clostripain-related cysteine peptidase [Lachnospiraceae bacterium]
MKKKCYILFYLLLGITLTACGEMKDDTASTQEETQNNKESDEADSEKEADKKADDTSESDGTGEADATEDEKKEQLAADASDEDKDDTWAIYWYLCGSDLESQYGAATEDLIETMGATLSDNVTVVVEAGGSSSWQMDGISANELSRYVYQNGEMEKVETVEQANMGEGSTFEGFLDYCETNYPADKKMLLFWNHGGGSTGGVAYDENYDFDSLTLQEIQTVLQNTYGTEKNASDIEQTSISKTDQADTVDTTETAKSDDSATEISKQQEEVSKPFELVGFDACLMATLDTANVLQPYANYMVASEESEPENGWEYETWLGSLSKNTSINGAKLGKIICDAYAKGCKEMGAEQEITLSVTDLSKINSLIAAVDDMSEEVLLKASQNSNICTEFARNARQAENYGGNNSLDGYANMVDLGDLADSAKSILEESYEPLQKAIEAAVVYQVNGTYRQEASGLSVYYSYDADKDNLQEYQETAAGDIYPELIQYALGEDLSQETADLLGIQPQSDVKPLDAGTPLPLSISEEGYIVLSLNEAVRSQVQSVSFDMAFVDYTGEQLIYLGSDNDIVADWDMGMFQDNFRGVWGAIDGHRCYMELTYEGSDYNLYTVPLRVNGEYCNMSVVYKYDKEKYEILGVGTQINSETGMADKNKTQLKPGDMVQPVFDTLDTSEANTGAGTYESKPFTWKEGMEFEETDLQDGDYAYTYCVTDIMGNEIKAQTAYFHYENEEVTASLD